MTPQERALVTELFDRLATLETNRRDPEAELLIANGLARAPNAAYALAQTVLLQDEALKQAEARIREAERQANAAAPEGGFLDNMRKEGLGRGSVPTIPQASKWNTGRADGGTPAPAAPTASQIQQEPVGHGGSFLGTAAAAAVGVIGGSLLFSGLRNMIGGSQAFGAPSDDGVERHSPWDSDASRGELARDAGLNDIGNIGASRQDNRGAHATGLLDSDNSDTDQLFSDNSGGMDGGGFGDGGNA